MDYKNTLNLPQTDFPMKADLVAREPQRLEQWYAKKLYQRIQELDEGGMSLRKIGEELGVARNTVRKYFRQPPEPPLPTPRPLRASKLDRYEDYILTRYAPGMQKRSSDPP